MWFDCFSTVARLMATRRRCFGVSLSASDQTIHIGSDGDSGDGQDAGPGSAPVPQEDSLSLQPEIPSAPDVYHGVYFAGSDHFSLTRLI